MPQTAPPTITEEDFIHKISKAIMTSCAATPSNGMSTADRVAYLAMLNGEQPAPLDPDKANRILGALWSVMTAFVDLGFGIGPVAPDTSILCGKLGKSDAVKCDKASGDAVHSPHHTNTNLNDRAFAVGNDIAVSNGIAEGGEA